MAHIFAETFDALCGNVSIYRLALDSSTLERRNIISYVAVVALCIGKRNLRTFVIIGSSDKKMCNFVISGHVMIKATSFWVH